MLARHMREIAESLNVFTRGFSSFLNRREKLILGHLGVILAKSRKKLGFQVDPRVMESLGRLLN